MPLASLMVLLLVAATGISLAFGELPSCSPDSAPTRPTLATERDAGSRAFITVGCQHMTVTDASYAVTRFSLDGQPCCTRRAERPARRPHWVILTRSPTL